jgi:hypothetical protein
MLFSPFRTSTSPDFSATSGVSRRCGTNVMIMETPPQNQRPKAVAIRGTVSPETNVALPDAQTCAETADAVLVPETGWTSPRPTPLAGPLVPQTPPSRVSVTAVCEHRRQNGQRKRLGDLTVAE